MQKCIRHFLLLFIKFEYILAKNTHSVNVPNDVFIQADTFLQTYLLVTDKLFIILDERREQTHLVSSLNVLVKTVADTLAVTHLAEYTAVR